MKHSIVISTEQFYFEAAISRCFPARIRFDNPAFLQPCVVWASMNCEVIPICRIKQLQCSWRQSIPNRIDIALVFTPQSF